MLAVQYTRCCWISNGIENAAIISRTRRWPSCGEAPSITITNSSPPKRHKISVERAFSVMRFVAIINSWSPASCPSVSLTNLKWSKSKNSSNTCCPVRSALAIACSSRCLNRLRFGRPVNSSCEAKNSTRRLSATISLTSRPTPR